ncbi:MAG: glycine cleavage system protein R [Cyanobacteria bacterium DS2.3.42]|nr:glycine cleavage system protein R [Cyanobacteria bacterium DS2.3.42]
MKEHLLVTAVGEDRPGIVSHLAEVITRHGANLEDSRMTVLGGEFAAIALVTVTPAKMPELLKDLESLAKEKISVTTRKTKPSDESRFKGYNTYQVSLTGADHEGIVHKISSYLKNHNINIQSMETELVPAPETGTPLFCMNAIVLVPPEISFKKLNEELNALGQEEAVEVDLAAYIESGQEVGV